MGLGLGLWDWDQGVYHDEVSRYTDTPGWDSFLRVRVRVGVELRVMGWGAAVASEGKVSGVGV